MIDEQGNAVDASVASIVEKLRRTNEIVWLCAPEREGRITILLIEKGKVEDVREFERTTGLNGGAGRSFQVQQSGSEWKIVSQGTWIS